MDLRNCAARHFIQTIRDGVVIKVCNINSHGRPAIRFKTLKDIYESEDAKRQGRPAGLTIDHEQVKCQSPCFPVAQRTLRQAKPKNDEFVPCADDGVDSDLDDGTTLKQLWKMFRTKKRKHSPSDENSKLNSAYETSVENDPDLNEPLINWKSRYSKKSKDKKKRMKLSVASSSTIAVTFKSEQDMVSKGSLQFGAELAPVTCVKVEVPDTDQLGCQNKTSANNSPISHNNVLNPGNKTSNELQNMVLCEYREPLLSVHEYQNLVTHETSWDDFEDVEPIAMLFPWNGTTVNLETLESEYEHLLDFPPLAIKNTEEIGEAYSRRVSPFGDQISDGYGHCRSSSSTKELSEQSSSDIHVPDMGMRCQQEFNLVLFQDKANTDSPYKQDDTPTIPEENSSSHPDSVISLKTENNVVLKKDAISDAEQPSTCPMDAITNNGLNCGSQIEDRLPKSDGKKTSAVSCSDSESKSMENQTSNSADTFSTPESCAPERLLSTRQAISPSSQERLCLAMNSVELCNETDQFKRKGNLFEKQTGKKVSPIRSETQHANITVNHGRPGQLSQRKVIISSRNTTMKSQISKGNLEGPRFSRTLPNLSTGCASVQVCSESAIAFSQRQMHDMESLAVKLMNELKSMKDIVEQKLLFEAYRNASLKNEADEVKSAINHATKVEEMAKKWMSIMTRDCNRFCKIMKMTPNSTAPSKDAIPRGKKKIVFADEAGGKLCHVKFLGDYETSPSSNHTKK